MPLVTTDPLASTSSIGSALPQTNDGQKSAVDKAAEKITFASKIIKDLSILRSDPRYVEQTRSADTGQALQFRLNSMPPRLCPEHEATKLYNFFIAWTQEWERGMTGLAVENRIGASLGDVVPPWDFVWLDEYICDPSVPTLDKVPPVPDVNGHRITDELCVNKGCDCDNDECDPRTCACLRRAAECYPYQESHYQHMFTPPTNTQVPIVPEFAYDRDGRLVNHLPFGTPIFECNSLCSCSSSCPNRVVQKGKSAKLAFFKTEGKGWGIKTLDYLPKGSFVGTYGGELTNDEESERRAKVYEGLLGTTYLQVLDSHIIKVHLTRQIIEKELAERNELDRYRESRSGKRELVRLITHATDLIERYDEYYHYLESHRDEEPGLFEAELSVKEGKQDIASASHLLTRATNNAHNRAQDWAFQQRAKAISRNPALAFQEAPIRPETDFNDPLYDFLSLSAAEQQQARKMRNIRSDMEDAQQVTVDSALWGNHTRFFNHSCDPNIYHVPVYTDNASIMRPLLAFFTYKKVKEGEELCFNYAGGHPEEDKDVGAAAAASSTPLSPAKARGRHKAALTMAGAGADTTATFAAASQEEAAVTSAGKLVIKCRCGAKNCTGRVFA
ncbi:histone-lysine N-methyltransferase [Pseudozyma hubeiensis SY62]|uniref:Histone-lysine N-methyltransferase n=1 Tax=Pseudozyma hubeiensis (strain SY62) TaxID=1305764 RepID=R9P9A0_PSEHS|nr:histone-lysine N-methyltransferase [Pseudozyma hubeiensis SY62]GAC97919.1 histone-lysine N-methyltransferase [Pseudozyma hubeiensis SY62]